MNHVWETVYGRDLVSWAASPTSTSNSDAMLELQDFLAEQFRAHDFDLSRLYTWVIAAKPFQLAAPDVWQSPRYATASAKDFQLAEARVSTFASFGSPKRDRNLKELLAMVDVSEGGLIDTLDDSMLIRRRALLGQFEPSRPVYATKVNELPQDIAKNALRASLEAVELDSDVLPVSWLRDIDGPDAFQQQAEHLYYVAGYIEPTNQQREIARVLRSTAGTDSKALQQLWWILSSQ